MLISPATTAKRRQQQFPNSITQFHSGPIRCRRQQPCVAHCGSAAKGQPSLRGEKIAPARSIAPGIRRKEGFDDAGVNQTVGIKHEVELLQPIIALPMLMARP